jgi:putative transposase
MHVHLVFVTKYRREVFSKTTLDDLRTIFASVCADFEAELVEFSGSDDHVHLLVNYPPKVAALPSKLFANTSNSSKPLTESQNSRTDLPSALSFPGMNAEVCRATRSSLIWSLRSRLFL